MFNRVRAFLLAARVGAKAVSIHPQSTCCCYFSLSRPHRWQNSCHLCAIYGKHELVVRFLRGARRLNPPRPPSIPSWDLSLVLQALQDAPFEPLKSADLKLLSLKILLLIALASIKRVGGLQAFSVDESCLEFGPGDNHVVLRPRPGYVPKVPTTPFRDQVLGWVPYVYTSTAAPNRSPVSFPWAKLPNIHMQYNLRASPYVFFHITPLKKVTSAAFPFHRMGTLSQCYPIISLYGLSWNNSDGYALCKPFPIVRPGKKGYRLTPGAGWGAAAVALW